MLWFSMNRLFQLFLIRHSMKYLLQILHITSTSALVSRADESVSLAIRGAENPQDYCSVARDLELMYSKLRPGGVVVVAGGPKSVFTYIMMF